MCGMLVAYLCVLCLSPLNHRTMIFPWQLCMYRTDSGSEKEKHRTQRKSTTDQTKPNYPSSGDGNDPKSSPNQTVSNRTPVDKERKRKTTERRGKKNGKSRGTKKSQGERGINMVFTQLVSTSITWMNRSFFFCIYHKLVDKSTRSFPLICHFSNVFCSCCARVAYLRFLCAVAIILLAANMAPKLAVPEGSSCMVGACCPFPNSSMVSQAGGDLFMAEWLRCKCYVNVLFIFQKRMFLQLAAVYIPPSPISTLSISIGIGC